MSHAARATCYRAGWLIPAFGPPIRDGVLVCAEGRIARLGPWSRVGKHVSAEDAVEAYPDAVILPGFVNAHTHLSLSDLAGKFRPTANFCGWIGRLAATRLTRTKGAIRRAVSRGAEASRAAGTVAGADVTTEPEYDEALSTFPARWRVFGEILKFGDAGMKCVEDRIEVVERLVEQAGVAPGLAPHAPYTVGVETFVRARREADRRGWPVGAHLHETLDEIAFTERGEGDLHRWLSRLGFLPRDWRPAGRRPIRMLADAGFFGGPVLVAHGNYLDDEEIGLLARSGSSVAYCPRSHAFFQHRDHTWRRLLDAGVNVCLGTDSLASSPSLSVLDEMRFLQRREPGADPGALLEMGTARGARALGMGDEVGDLRQGMAASFCVVGPVEGTEEPLAAILAGEGEVVRTVIAGSRGNA